MNHEEITGVVLLFAGMSGTLCYIPQVIKLFKTKKSEDLSTYGWVMTLLSGFLYGVYSIFIGGALYRFICWFDFMLILLTLILTLLYKKRNLKGMGECCNVTEQEK